MTDEKHRAKLIITVILTSVQIAVIIAVGDHLSEHHDRYEPERNCSCVNRKCYCCVNLTTILGDIGGPKCTYLQYLNPVDGVLVVVHFGRLQNVSRKFRVPKHIEKPVSVCSQMFGVFVQMCTQVGVAPVDNGMVVCLDLESRVLNMPQKKLHFGCFKGTNETGMTQVSNDFYHHDELHHDVFNPDPDVPHYNELRITLDIELKDLRLTV